MSWRARAGADVFTAAVKRELLTRAGSNIKPILDPFVIDRDEHDAVARAGRRLLAVQRRLLKTHFRPRMTMSELLAHFHAPRELDRLLTWDELVSEAPQVARHDVLIGADGAFRICELNVDSSVGGGEAHALARLYLESFGLALPLATRARLLAGPHVLLAALLGRQCDLFARSRLVLLDWSSWAARGFFATSLLRDALERALPDVEIVVRDERSYERELASGQAASDLVYRLFLAEDALGDPAFPRRLRESGARLISGFESEIYSSKRWLAHFHDESFRAALSSQERDLIDSVVPFTAEVDRDNLARLLDDKDRYVWKPVGGFGGRGLAIGARCSRAELESAVRAAAPGAWIVQELIEPRRFDWMDDDAGRTRQLGVVLGVYEIGGRACGALVRADDATDIINVGNGARIGWALALSGGETEEIG
jgi:hypothetical protein